MKLNWRCNRIPSLFPLPPSLPSFSAFTPLTLYIYPLRLSNSPSLFTFTPPILSTYLSLSLSICLSVSLSIHPCLNLCTSLILSIYVFISPNLYLSFDAPIPRGMYSTKYLSKMFHSKMLKNHCTWQH